MARRGGSSKQEPATGRSLVDRAPDDVPGLGHQLPFIDQDGATRCGDAARVSLEDRLLSWAIESEHGFGSPHGGRCLAHRTRSLDGDRRHVRHQFVEFIVDDATPVVVHHRF
jgi:hypothetical protein